MEYHYVQLANMLEKQIQAGDYRAGDKLPSLRKLKAATGRSISTINQAYQELENRGLVDVREKSGFFVKPLLKDVLPLPNQSTSPVKSHKVAINVLSSLIQRSLDNQELVPFGEATASHSLLPGRQLAASVRSATAGYQNGSCSGYGAAAGLEKLQREIARRSLCTPDHGCGSEIIITQGCMNAIELCLRSVARPGDIILLESPTFLCYLQLIEDLNMQAMEIPADPSLGLNLEKIRKSLDEHDIRAALFNPSCQNPLGYSMPMAARKELVSLFNERGIPVIEDDIYGDLYFGESQSLPLKYFDRQGLVLYCSSFSKALLPDMRIGWLLAGKYREKVKRLKFNNSIAGSQLMQHALALFLENGGYDRHLRRLRNSLRRQAADMSRAVARYFPSGTRVSSPKGGLSLWVELPDSVDSLELFHLAEKENIAIMPGTLCSGTGRYDHCIRLCYGHPWNERLEEGMDTLGRLARSLIKPTETERSDVGEGEIAVGLNSDPKTLRIDPLIRCFSSTETGMVLEFHQSISGNILKLIASGELHGGFVFGKCDDDRFVVQHLATHYLRIVGPMQMAERIINADYKDLAELPWIGNPAECPYCQMIEEIFCDRGLCPRIVMAANAESAILSLIKAGVGLNFMFEEQAQKLAAEGNLVVWEQERFAFPLSFVTLQSAQGTLQVQAIKKMVDKVWR